MARWIRLDVTWDASEWVAGLSPLAQLAWVKLLCWVKVQGKGGRCKALAPTAAGKKWDVPPRAVAEMLSSAPADALTEKDGEWVILKWGTYQEPDPTANERKRRQRELDDCHACHAVTSPEDGVTRRVTTDHQQEKAPSGAKSEKSRSMGLPPAWEPNDAHAKISDEEGRNLAREAQNFRDSALAHGRKYVDWDRAFCTWLRSEYGRNGKAKPPANSGALARPRL